MGQSDTSGTGESGQQASSTTDAQYEGWDDASPTYISSPRLRVEAQKALIWVGVIGLAALTVYISQSLLVIFAAQPVFRLTRPRSERDQTGTKSPRSES